MPRTSSLLQRPALLSAPHLQVQYLEIGNPAGTPVFLLHGFPDSPATWARTVQHLPLKRLRLIAPYVRGTGESRTRSEEHASGQVAALASDLLTLADLLGIERFHLVGQDWGARTAYAVAALAPERTRGILTLATPYVMFAGKPEPPTQAQAYWYQWYFNTEHGAKIFASDPAAFSEALWRAWSPKWRFSQGEFAEAAQAFANSQFVPTVLHSYRQRWKAAPGATPYAVPEAVLVAKPKISVPTIFGYGTEDACNLPASSADQGAWFAGPYERVAIKGAGHFPQREEPSTIAKLIERLLRSTS